jgi:hypothetical protein
VRSALADQALGGGEVQRHRQGGGFERRILLSHSDQVMAPGLRCGLAASLLEEALIARASRWLCCTRRGAHFPGTLAPSAPPPGLAALLAVLTHLFTVTHRSSERQCARARFGFIFAIHTV